MEVLKIQELSLEKRLQIAFNSNKANGFSEIASIVGCSFSTAFLVCKKFFRTRTLKNLPRVGRRKKFTMPWDERSLLRELRSNRFEILQEIMLSCKRKLNMGT